VGVGGVRDREWSLTAAGRVREEGGASLGRGEELLQQGTQGPPQGREGWGGQRGGWGGEEETYEEQKLNVHTRVGNQAGVGRVCQGFTGSSGEQRGGAGLAGERGGGGGTVGRRPRHTTQERRGRGGAGNGGAPPRDWEEDGVRRGRRWRAGERWG